MLKTQKKYLDYLKEVETKINTLKISDSVKESFLIKNLVDTVKQQELLVPVVGAFSAGKSSLINSFLKKEILPVGITPETALATELRYEKGENERIEAVKTDFSFDIFKVEEIGSIGKNAANYKFLRLYLSNKKLAEIEPLVLVDMPGFESPLDLHNKAIMEYLYKGVHYIVITSVEDGTITHSMIRQLEDIKEYKGDFSFFLSKSNLRAKEDIDSVKAALEEIISDALDLDKTVVPIDDNGGESLNKILKQIEPEKLFKSVFIDGLKDFYYTISDAINTSISTLSKSKEDNERSLKELEVSIENIRKKREELIENAKEKYSDINLSRVIDNVGREISNNVEELSRIAISGGQEALSDKISEIVRSALISNINLTMTDIGNDIVDSFSINLTELNNFDSNSILSNRFIDEISGRTKQLLDSTITGLGAFGKKNKENKELYKAITGILAITTNIVTPLIELIIVFLPDILDIFFRGAQEQKQKETIKNAILGNIIPSTKRKLRETLPQVFNKQLEELINNVSNKFEEEINMKKEVISSTQNELKAKIKDVDATISDYKKINDEINTLSNTVIFK